MREKLILAVLLAVIGLCSWSLASQQGGDTCERPLLRCLNDNSIETLRCHTWMRWAECLERGGCK